MHGIRFVIGRPRGSSSTAIQSIVFDANEWTDADARSWLDRQGFKPRNLGKSGRLLRYRMREQKDFEPRSFRTIDTGRREKVTMSSNSRKKKRHGKKRAKRNPMPKRRAKRSKAKRSRPAKTVRTMVKTTKVMKSNARKRPKKKKPRRNPTTRYTIALAPSSARTLATMARITKQRRHDMLKALRRHPSGGVYVALPAWHGSHREAEKMQESARMVLAYAAGRRRASLPAASLPRVVAVP